MPAAKTTGSQASAAPTPLGAVAAEPAGVTFYSPHANLIVYHKEHKIAVFG